jgi:hypothetical protein
LLWLTRGLKPIRTLATFATAEVCHALPALVAPFECGLRCLWCCNGIGTNDDGINAPMLAIRSFLEPLPITRFAVFALKRMEAATGQNRGICNSLPLPRLLWCWCGRSGLTAVRAAVNPKVDVCA